MRSLPEMYEVLLKLKAIFSGVTNEAKPPSTSKYLTEYFINNGTTYRKFIPGFRKVVNMLTAVSIWVVLL